MGVILNFESAQFTFSLLSDLLVLYFTRVFLSPSPSFCPACSADLTQH
jgi:hypothetical protein